VNLKPQGFVFLVFLLWLATVIGAEEIHFVGVITADHVNLRAGPGQSYEVLQKLSKGTPLQVLERKDSWYGVRLAPDVSVYVHERFLRWHEAGAQVQGHRVHVRAGAGQAFTSMGFLGSAQQVKVRRRMGEWVEIEPPDFCRGWVNKAYVTFYEAMNQPSI